MTDPWHRPDRGNAGGSEPAAGVAPGVETREERRATMTRILTNNAASLAAAIDGGRHCEPASRIVRDGQHAGTLFTWVDRCWIVCDLENPIRPSRHDRLAVVTVTQQQAGTDVADAGLNQCCLACDLEAGEWVIDADDLPELRQTYGDVLDVLWEQAAA